MSVLRSSHNNSAGEFSTAVSPLGRLVAFLGNQFGRLGRGEKPVKRNGQFWPQQSEHTALRTVPAPAEGGPRDVYIIGGGPSLKGVDLSPLSDKAVIAVNYSIFSVPTASYFVTLDPRFFSKVKTRLEEFNNHPATKVLIHNWPADRVQFRPLAGLTVGPSKADFSAFKLVIHSTVAQGFGKTFLDFRHGSNSGYCAIQFAMLLGYERIHLLGFDLTDAGGQQHFHDAYQLDRNCLPAYIRHFEEGFKSLPAAWPNVQVISHSAVSALNGMIPYEPLNVQ
jgi:hypothetical protein